MSFYTDPIRLLIYVLVVIVVIAIVVLLLRFVFSVFSIAYIPFEYSTVQTQINSIAHVLSSHLYPSS
jgi:uncharacterized membrane protein